MQPRLGPLADRTSKRPQFEGHIRTSQAEGAPQTKSHEKKPG